MASEIRATGIDLSFAPVVDLGRGNRAIGNRAFHAEPEIVAAFTRAYVRGMHAAGMAATLKHFPGPRLGAGRHALRRGGRPALRWTNCARSDLLPFVAGIEAGADAVMMAHVQLPGGGAGAGRLLAALDATEILRDDMGFRGVVLQDDIGMAAAESAGGVKARIDAHLDAGCDVVLVCPPALVDESLHAMDARPPGNNAAIVCAARSRRGRLGRPARGSALR